MLRSLEGARRAPGTVLCLHLCRYVGCLISRPAGSTELGSSAWTALLPWSSFLPSFLSPSLQEGRRAPPTLPSETPAQKDKWPSHKTVLIGKKIIFPLKLSKRCQAKLLCRSLSVLVILVVMLSLSHTSLADRVPDTLQLGSVISQQPAVRS